MKPGQQIHNKGIVPPQLLLSPTQHQGVGHLRNCSRLTPSNLAGAIFPLRSLRWQSNMLISTAQLAKKLKTYWWTAIQMINVIWKVLVYFPSNRLTFAKAKAKAKAQFRLCWLNPMLRMAMLTSIRIKFSIAINYWMWRTKLSINPLRSQQAR